jgi:peptide/nickel transport system ATP-binding protein
MDRTPVLSIANLDVVYRTDPAVVALKHVDLQVYPGETVGIVGESGCGKSTLAFSIMGYLHPLARTTGQILFDGLDLRTMNRRQLASYRGSRMSMVFQNPFSSLNPSIKIGEQLAEVGRYHKNQGRKAAWQSARDILDKLNIPDPDQVVDRYPHQVSGGMQQRVCIAMALLCEPRLLIMDEPTTALDVTTEVVILDMIKDLKKSFNTSILYITHDLRIVSSMADWVAVMYKGEVVETASRKDLFEQPRHPYTIGLLGCIPHRGVTKHNHTLITIPGYVTKRSEHDDTCPFRERCTMTGSSCEDAYIFREVAPGHFCSCDRSSLATENPAVKELPALLKPAVTPDTSDIAANIAGNEILLELKNLKVHYNGKRVVRAVDGIDFYLRRNHIMGIVGESGCGKTTTALAVQGLMESSSGTMTYRGQDITMPWFKRKCSVLKDIQMVFQNPEKSLNPAFTIERLLERPIKVFHPETVSADRRRIIIETLQKVGLSEDYLARKPTQLSGGELQRVAIARVFVVNPNLVICDEPTSSLDVSVQSAVLNLLISLQRQTEISYLFISHDLHVVNYISDYIIIMYLGRICEFGTTNDIFAPPYHPYTEALISAVPEMERDVARTLIRLEGSVPSLGGAMAGCPFSSRCPRKLGTLCDDVQPPRVDVSPTHRYFCHIDPQTLMKIQSGYAW